MGGDPEERRQRSRVAAGSRPWKLQDGMDMAAQDSAGHGSDADGSGSAGASREARPTSGGWRIASADVRHSRRPWCYLDEFTFRFNRRTSRSRGQLFYRLMQNAMAVGPASYKDVIKGIRGSDRQNHNIYGRLELRKYPIKKN